ncbi:cyanophycinase [uncultured Cocleimonas sp.]|uniref:cyanophycinase n=1 Tax=uncultured Cocleimonas sp. TaxID=1051587 RepID=UPI0026170342|nr:cyanophycinase [uncultured Cocleimonas sp.]
MGSRDFEANPLRGFVIPIGGAEERLNDPVILTRFVEICGNEKARIAIIPTASQLDDTGPNYEKVFKDLGAGEAISLPINTREDAQQESFLETLTSCNGIFITGGNQLRLSTILGGTPIAQAIRRLNAAGVHLAGTSAGAAIIPEHMIAGGSTGALPTEQGVTFAPGLGLLNKVIIDQHFSQRNRLGRLLSAVSYNPFASGLGICEDTAAFIGPDNLLEVIGNGSITVIDPSELQYSSMAEASRGDSLTLLGIKMHILSEGASYNIETREAQPKHF